MFEKLSKKTTPRQWLLMATLGILVCFSSIAIVSTFSGKPLATADEALHLDYAWQVYNHKLPSFKEGPLLETDLRVMPDVQWTYQHPPLYYAILAPVVGPLIANDHTLAAVAAGRLVNIFLGGVFIVCVGWLAYLLSSRNRKLTAIVAMVITSVSSIFIGVSSAIYNDNLFLILSCLALCLTVLILKNEKPSTRLMSLLAIVCALGMLSRITFAITLCFVLAGLLLRYYRPLKNKWRSITGVLLPITALAAIPVVASSWFYLKNLRESGNIMGGQSEYAQQHLSRVDRDYFSVITSPSFWETVGQILSKPMQMITLVAIFLLLAWLIIYLYRLVARKEMPQLSHVINIGLVLFLFAHIAMLLYYVSNLGGEHVRYLLPILPILSYFIARYAVSLPSTKLFLALGLGIFLLFSSGLRSLSIAAGNEELFVGRFHDYLAARGFTDVLPIVEHGLFVYWLVGALAVIIGSYCLLKRDSEPLAPTRESSS